MLSAEMEKELNEQVNKEFYSSYLYLAMSAFFERTNLPGFANWMRVQSLEEYAHALRFLDHIIARDGTVHLGAVGEPPIDFGTPLEVFQKALEHEKMISASINALFDHAERADEPLLHFFVAEQIEEEATASRIVESLKLAGESGPGLLLLDREMGARVLPPAVIAALTGSAAG
jgi:ferritin